MTGRRIPVGRWIRVHLPNVGLEGDTLVAFTYLDSQAGFSAAGDAVKAGSGTAPGGAGDRVIVRLSKDPERWEALDEADAVGLGLPSRPEWLDHYGPQPEAGTPWGMWRDHPKLQGRFHPDCADDLQVLVHDGGPRLSDRSPEAVWVRMTGCDGDVFRGTVLNQPHHLQTVRQFQSIRFQMPDGAEFPVMATDKYLRERPGWDILPCRKCGLSELFDAPSDLIAKVFPHVGAAAREGETVVMDRFTSFCPLCGGVMLVKNRDAAALRTPPSPGPPPPERSGPTTKPWWKFW
jgi:hypothetical protein